MILAFTGTRGGMTGWQAAAVARALWSLDPTVVRHGDCVGADEQFADIAALTAARQDIHPGHPPGRPADDRYRAHVGRRPYIHGSVVHAPVAYMTRNRAIVSGADYLLATPRGDRPIPRSGTWATIAIAARAGTLGDVILPDGTTRPLTLALDY